MNIQYSYLKSIWKGIKYPVIVILGFVISGFIGDYPRYAELTVGGLLIFIYDWIKHKAGVRLP